MEFKLDRSGYITKYLYSGRKETEIYDKSSDTNQLRYEKYLRGMIAEHKEMIPPTEMLLGENSSLGLPWKYYYSYENSFMDVSSAYTELRRIDVYAVTGLTVIEDMEVTAYLWSCAAVDMWVNGQPIGRIEKPVYKPIQRVEVKLPLKKGNNQIFIRLETLGVRDTRISFAIQILERQEQIHVTLPDEEGISPYIKAEELLSSAVLKGNKLLFSDKLPLGSSINYNTGNRDYRKWKETFIEEDISGNSDITLKNYASFQVGITIGNSTIKRNFERIELRASQYLDTTGTNHYETLYSKIAEVSSIIRKESDGFALYPMLARYHLGQRMKSDEEELTITLSQIERRMDCADFMTCGLIRFIKNYEVSNEIREEIKRVMLKFRYWMDEEGQDGMCFWSENHSLMFYQTAYFFGQEYPEEVFLRSGRTGNEMYQNAKCRLKEWLTDVCEQGYDEFNSGVYTPITFAAVLNLVDYAEEDIAEMAKKAADLLLRSFAVHCFSNVIISPQGRVYRDVLYPHLQALQSLVQFVNPKAPYVYNEWLSAMATSKYKIPEDIISLMNRKGAFSYCSSNAIIDLYKTEDYLLTSVQSPRRDGKTRIWERNQTEGVQDTFIYTKSLNECFHGTMQFEPGVLGYQQHLWYAAIDPELVVFTNHPGGTCEDMPEVRPGYWYGNGITPSLRQENNVLGIIYVIPDTQPIHFVHLYWNEKKFSETVQTVGWLFGRKDRSYIAIWCSKEMNDHNDVLFECEKRTYGDKVAYLCICGSEKEEGNFETFMQKCLNETVQFKEESNRLSCRYFNMVFKECKNQTQYVE